MPGDDSEAGIAGPRGKDPFLDLGTGMPVVNEPLHDQADYGSMIRYLSLDWISALSLEVASSAQMREIAATHSIGVTQVVTDGPEGDVTYHLSIDEGEASFGPGPADPEDVRMEQNWDTAVAVATGELNAQEAFIGGQIRLHGDQQKLLDSQPVFGVLNAVFASVRDRTSYE